MKQFLKTTLIASVVLAGVSAAMAGDPIATLRGTEINVEPTAPMMTKEVNTDVREVRSYPEQPPTIPHNIRGYQIDLKANKCLSCHSRTAVGQSQAPMVSITHFTDRDGQTLAAVTPRRYFCTQCHVPQHTSKPLVANEFIDADKLINK